MSEVYDQGYYAFKAGRLLNDNPYGLLRLRKRNMWIRGWMDAKKYTYG
jgi:ribosome modulation factor